MKTNWPALRHGCLILASIAVAAVPAFAQTQELSGTTATVCFDGHLAPESPMRTGL